jgi:hypothetical protein
VRNQDFRDAAAVQFAPRGKRGDFVGLPFLGMGDAQAAVTSWHWKADWEEDIAAGRHRDVGSRYLAMHADRLHPRADLTTDAVFLAGLAAGNPFSARERKTPVEVLVARGFGTLTSLPPAYQTVEGRGVWRDGRWAVVLRRTLKSAVAPDLGRGQTREVAFAVWDGAAGDRNGQKAISQWIELAIEK